MKRQSVIEFLREKGIDKEKINARREINKSWKTKEQIKALPPTKVTEP